MNNQASRPHGPRLPLASPRSGWDVGQLSRALNRQPELVDDPAFARGLRYRLGERGALVVDLFPPTAERRAGVARFATADLDLVLFRQGVPAIGEDGVLFRTSDHVVLLTPSGGLTLYRAVTD